MPDVDNVLGSSMRPLTKVNEQGETVEDIRSVQLNEKISDTIYQILHPETDAYQVITDPNRRFVSEEEKAKWNEAYNLGASALHYRGEYSAATLYKLYDIVYLNGAAHGEGNTPYGDKGDGNGRRFFIYTNELATPESGGKNALAPEYDAFISNQWININFESYLAEFSKNVKIEQADQDTAYKIALFNYKDNTYDVVKTTNAFIINPVKKQIVIDDIIIDGSTGTITANKFVGDLDGTATKAEYAEVANKYQQYLRDPNTHEAILDAQGNLQPDGTEYIDESLAGLEKRIDDITHGTGGAVLSNKLYVAKNGVDQNSGFDGSETQRVNITFNPTEIDDLLDSSKKIKEKWLPETLLGAMTYIGTFDPSTGTLATDLRDPAGRPFRKGDYAIAIANGNQDPSGANHTSDTAETYYYLTGDWAIYNGDLDGGNDVDAEEWTKIDNTDAVRTVNSQIGDVKIYKGDWTPNVQYYAGDMVQYGDPAALYLCVQNSNGATFDLNSFKIFGRIYKAADGLELTEEDNTFRHLYKEATTVESGTPIKLKPKETISVSKVELNDEFGHIARNVITTYEMPDDTWRPVHVNGELKQDETVTSGPLDIGHDFNNLDRRVDVQYENGKITVVHNLNVPKKGDSHTSTVLTEPVAAGQVKIGLGSQFTAPNFGWGNTGHVDSYSQTIFELPANLIQHKHFNVALDDGCSIIRSFTAKEYTELADKSRKYVDANLDGTWVVPFSTEKMTFNGAYASTELFQTSKTDAGNLYRVVDESVKIYHGVNYNNQEILTRYDNGSRRFVQDDSGIHGQGGSVVYSAIAVNRKGIATAGGQILEFGQGREVDGEWVSDDPSDSLVIGGLFFRNVGPKRDSNGQTV